MSKIVDELSGTGALALAFTLVVATFATVFYAMSLKWPLADILQVAGIFVPFVASAVAFYFGNKNSNGLIDNAKQGLNNDKIRLDNDNKRLSLVEKGIMQP